MSGKRKAEASRWVRQAGYDLQAARWTIEGGFHDTACFLAQQAGAKALKSLLYYLGARRLALLTHSLVEMLGETAKRLPELERLLPDARELDPRPAIQTACPVATPTRSTGERSPRGRSRRPIGSSAP
jgi:HEPN domain-containing protein